jgi:hypothetical protein
MIRSSQCHNTHARQHEAFHIRARPHQILDILAMIHPHHVLLDDRSLIEVFGQ